MTFYDVQQMIDFFRQQPGSFHIAKKLGRLRSLKSIQFDLRRCHDAISHLSAVAKSRHEGEPMTHIGGLIDAGLATFAIITYGKCTDTASIDGPNKRGEFDPRRHYNALQLEWHENIMGLRNEAVAHYGPGKHPDGDWVDDQLVMVADHKGNPAGFLDNNVRLNYKARALMEMSELLPSAREGIAKDIAKLEVKLLSDLASYPELHNIIKNMQTVPCTFEGSAFTPRVMLIDENGISEA